jgi:hypothetical protein
MLREPLKLRTCESGGIGRRTDLGSCAAYYAHLICVCIRLQNKDLEPHHIPVPTRRSKQAVATILATVRFVLC